MQNPNSAEIVASIDDLLTKILLSIPIKPLMRFKSVNKHWLSLINNHTFCQRRNPSPNPATGLFIRTQDESKFSYDYISIYPDINQNPPPFNFDFAIDPKKTEILQSCNGLILCCSSEKWNDDGYIIHEGDCVIYVYNPTTNSSVTIIDSTIARWHFHGATLVFEPDKSPHYKVVLAMFVYPSETVRLCQIRVYSSETGRWTDDFAQVDVVRVGEVCGGGVYWNGSVHWLYNDFLVENPKTSTRFHVDTMVLSEMPSPPGLHENRRSVYYFGESCGHLQYIQDLLPKLDVYELRRDYSEWFVKYRVDVTSLAKAFPEVIRVSFLQHASYVGYVLSLVRGEDDKDLTLVIRIPGKVVKFNMVDGTSEKLCDFEHGKIEHEIAFVGDDDDDEAQETYKFIDECGLDYIQSICSC